MSALVKTKNISRESLVTCVLMFWRMPIFASSKNKTRVRTFILFHQKSFKQYGKDFGNASGRTRKNVVPDQERVEL